MDARRLRKELAAQEEELRRLEAEDERLNRAVTRNGWGFTTAVVDSPERNRARHSEYQELKEAWARVRADLKEAGRATERARAAVAAQEAQERAEQDRNEHEHDEASRKAQDNAKDARAARRAAQKERARSKEVEATTPKAVVVANPAWEGRSVLSGARSPAQVEALRRLTKLGHSAGQASLHGEAGSTVQAWRAAALRSQDLPSAADVDALDPSERTTWLKRVHQVWLELDASQEWLDQETQKESRRTWAHWARSAGKAAADSVLKDVLPVVVLVLGLVGGVHAGLILAGLLAVMVASAPLWWRWHSGARSSALRYSWSSGSLLALPAGVLGNWLWTTLTQGGGAAYLGATAAVGFVVLTWVVLAVTQLRPWFRLDSELARWPFRPETGLGGRSATLRSPAAGAAAMVHFRAHPEEFSS